MHKRGLIISLVFLISIYSVFAIMGHDPANVFPGQFNGNFTFNGSINVTGSLLADGSKLIGVLSAWNQTNGYLFTFNNSLNVGIGTETPVSKLTVAGNITPDANNTYSLGTPERVWKDIYVSNGSLYLGGNKLSNEGGLLKWGGQDVAAIGSEAPVGTILSYASAGVVPNGWLECNGQNVSRSYYSELFATIGTIYGAADGTVNFTLPDLRGVFLRGNDSGRGIDAGRVMGSYQDDAFKSHYHVLNMVMDAIPDGGSGYNSYPANSDNNNAGYGNNAAINVEGGTETRPKNLAVRYIIKAKYQGATGTNTGASPSFRVSFNNGGTQSISGGYTKVNFPVEDFDSHDFYNLTSNRFTPTIPGKYLLTAAIESNQIPSTNYLMAIINKNGATYAQGTRAPQGPVTDYHAATVSTIVEANGIDDTFELYVYYSSTSTDIGYQPYQTYFSGSRIDGGNGLWTRQASGNITYNNGNVGIGTGTPYFKFTVEGETGNGYIASFTNGSTNDKLMIKNTNGTVGVQAVSSTVSDAKNLTLNPLGGNVGVGKTNPNATLDVNGEIKGFGIVPIGSIVAWHKSMSGTPGLPDGWVECNGQTLSDSASPYNGQVIPNLNNQVYAGGRGRYLRGGTTSGTMSPSTYLSGNNNKYDFGSGGTYYGVGYGRVVNGEDGSTVTYSTTDNSLGTNYFQVTAMTVVWVMRVK